MSRAGWSGDVTATRTFRPSRWKTVGFVVLFAAVTVGGVVMVSDGETRGWVVAPLFGLGTLLLGVNLLPGSAYLRVGPEGFAVCSLFREHAYRWSDVGPFLVAWVHLHRMVVFNFSDSYRPLRRARKVAGAIAGFEGALPDSYGMSAAALAELLNRYRSAHGAAEGRRSG